MEEITKASPQSIVPKKSESNGSAFNSTSSAKGNPGQTQLQVQLVKRRKKRVKNWTIFAVIAVVAGAAIWFLLLKPETTQVTFIRYATVDKGDIVKSVTATGTLQATTTVQVGSQVSGTIRALHADFNTHVTKGQLIAELDPTFYEASVKAATANY